MNRLMGEWLDVKEANGEETRGQIVKAAIVVGVDSRVVRNKSNGIASY